MTSMQSWQARRYLFFVVALGLAGCAARQRPSSLPALAAGVGQQIVEGSGSVACVRADDDARQRAVDAALQNAVARATAAYGTGAVPVSEVVAAHRVDRYWQSDGQCLASVQAVVWISKLQSRAREETRGTLRTVGRPVLAFAVQSYRILPHTASVTRRAASEIIDALQQELITRGFDVRRSLRARQTTLAHGGSEVLDISSAERDQIAAAARHDGVAFLVQGEIKVSDEGQQADGEYLAVVDGSVEAVDLQTERIVGGFTDVARATNESASAAYTKAIAAFARSAATELAPQMLDTWTHAESVAP